MNVTFAHSLGIVISVFLLWRVYNVIVLQQNFGADTWVRFGLSGLILGGMYALIAIGYTLVYGIMFMINFAHGEVMMLGAFGGFFTFETLRFIPAPTAANPDLNFLNAHPFISVLLAFLVGISISAMAGYFLEKIAYRPLRKAPRLILSDYRNRRIDLSAKPGDAAFWSTAQECGQSRIFWIAAQAGS